MVPLPLPTIRHRSDAELLAAVQRIVADRMVGEIVIGLPLLPSGEEGSAAQRVQGFVTSLREILPSVRIAVLDERFTNPPRTAPEGVDTHAQAALQILQTHLQRKR